MLAWSRISSNCYMVGYHSSARIVLQIRRSFLPRIVMQVRNVCQPTKGCGPSRAIRRRPIVVVVVVVVVPAGCNARHTIGAVRPNVDDRPREIRHVQRTLSRPGVVRGQLGPYHPAYHRAYQRRVREREYVVHLGMVVVVVIDVSSTRCDYDDTLLHLVSSLPPFVVPRAVFVEGIVDYRVDPIPRPIPGVVLPLQLRDVYINIR